MKPGVLLVFALGIGVGILYSQSGSTESAPGAPLRGISRAELELFRAGLDDFTEVESADDGLGPAFNGASCAVCHSVPAIGGITPMTEIRAGYRDDDGVFHELNGGTLYHLFSIPNHRCQVTIPPEANVIARRAPIAVFGDGLIEAIADAAIVAQEDPNDRNGDGISGRAGWVTDVDSGRLRVGRFGWKSQQATLLAFSGDAYRNEMGITNDLFPNEMANGIDAATMLECSPKTGLEDVRDRRTGLRGIDNFANFMRFLAPIEKAELNAAARAGERLFTSVGCAACHTPSMTTAQNANPVFDRKPVNLFSDLLLHDIGSGDGIPQAAAKEDELRTPPLWGLRFRRPLMHDGASATVEDAIARHAGEAAKVTERFDGLMKQDREALLAFLAAL